MILRIRLDLEPKADVQREGLTVSHRGRANADELIAAALAAGRSHKDAATAAGVSEKTVFRRAAEAAFMVRVAALRAAMTAAAAGRLVDGMTEAAGVLRALLSHADPHIKHKAAVKLIELGLKVSEVAELEARVNHLEKTTPNITLTTEGPTPFTPSELRRIAREAASEVLRDYSEPSPPRPPEPEPEELRD